MNTMLLATAASISPTFEVSDFDVDLPPFPHEFIQTLMSDPGAFVDAMGEGVQAFGEAMDGGADIDSAVEAMGDAKGSMMSEIGVSPEMLEAAGEAFGAVAGPVMMSMPAEAGPTDMADCMHLSAIHMLPEGMPLPPGLEPLFENMADTFDDAGLGPQDIGAELVDAAAETETETLETATAETETLETPAPAVDFSSAIGAEDAGDGDAGSGLSDLGALGGELSIEGAELSEADVAIGGAIDGAVDQGGAVAGEAAASDQAADDAVVADVADEVDEVDTTDDGGGVG